MHAQVLILSEQGDFTSANSPAGLPQLGEGQGEWGRWWWLWGWRGQWCDLPFSWLTAYDELIYNSRQSIPLLVQSCFPMEDKSILFWINSQQQEGVWLIMVISKREVHCRKQTRSRKKMMAWCSPYHCYNMIQITRSLTRNTSLKIHKSTINFLLN